MSSKVHKQSLPQEEKWVCVPSVPNHENPIIAQEYSDIDKMCSSMSFDDSKLPEQTFLDIIHHCKNDRIRRVVHKFTKNFKLHVDIGELCSKLNELSQLCDKDNSLLRKIIVDASRTNFETQ